MHNDPALAGMFVTLDRFAPAVRQRIVRLYRESLVEQLGLLDQALAEGELDRAAQAAHKMASSAAMMQDLNVSPRAKDVENPALARSAEDARGAWPALKAAAETSLRQLEQAYPETA
ncbi:MAG: Hpt domain-containing protein [Burkholderiaceae bacterium]